jgi:hypothetical protein
MQCLRPEFSCKVNAQQETRIIGLVQRLLKTLDPGPLDPNKQPTPRHCFARFLEQVLTSRVSSHKKSPSNGSDRGQTPPVKPVRQQGLQQPATDVFPFPHFHEQPQMSADDMTNQLSLPPSDPAFLQAWNFMENQQMACSMESMFVMSDNSLSSDFTMFQDQSWFM